VKRLVQAQQASLQGRPMTLAQGCPKAVDALRPHSERQLLHLALSPTRCVWSTGEVSWCNSAEV